VPESASAAAVSRSGGAASTTDAISTPPYNESTAKRIIVEPRSWAGLEVVKVSDVNTTPEEGGHRHSGYKGEYTIKTIDGANYRLAGLFYGLDDLINKIVAAESLRQKASLSREDFDFTDRQVQKLSNSFDTAGNFSLRQKLNSSEPKRWPGHNRSDA
jgi:hypothetical protein